MARIRSIKPEFFRHEELQELGAIPMLVFAGLWCLSDKNGVFEWKPKHIKLDILPFMDFDIVEVMAQLEAAGLIQQFSDDSRQYGFIPRFNKHQTLQSKERDAPSRMPEPPKQDTGTIPEQFRDDTGTGEGLQEKEKEKEKEKINSFVGLDPTAPPVLDSEAEKKAAKDKKKADAEALSGILVAYLNDIGGRKYSPDAAKKLCTRFKDAKKADWDRIEAEARLIVEFKASQWLNDPEMKRNIAPETVWAPSHWPSYLSEANEWLESGKANTNAPLDIMAIAKQMAMAANQ